LSYARVVYAVLLLAEGFSAKDIGYRVRY